MEEAVTAWKDARHVLWFYMVAIHVLFDAYHRSQTFRAWNDR